jgi:hypothetical protein
LILLVRPDGFEPPTLGFEDRLRPLALEPHLFYLVADQDASRLGVGDADQGTGMSSALDA